jgi:hypothetical protein
MTVYVVMPDDATTFVVSEENPSVTLIVEADASTTIVTTEGPQGDQGGQGPAGPQGPSAAENEDYDPGDFTLLFDNALI